ncbi:hypothetical protein [Burkholderia ambifaria]|uniref:hypothetical protein n=1 Tax=Burkholderia ambifaria TaxID=152480 RepID=UPI00158CDF21|nr:hypothetical protein [Burkholderia ambifaria]MBR8348018.1 hypothetical protein [Burkholderia ambifaria]
MASDDPDRGGRAPRDYARQIFAMFKRTLPEDLPVLDSQDVLESANRGITISHLK